jgi:Uncharacterized alpha/beta hydrolase domain (DUF2235)
MTDASSTKVPAHPLGPTPGIKPVTCSVAPQAHQCQMQLHIGVFFDGTGNNQDWVEAGQSGTQLHRRKDSNVARLFRAYRDAPDEGYFPMYVPGVGTPFDKIGEHKPSSLGAACGAGGDGRINFGLIHVINAIHSTVSPNSKLYAEAHTTLALCRNGRLPSGIEPGDAAGMLARPEDAAALRAVNMGGKGGLLLDAAGNAAQRVQFFKRACAQIKQKMQANPKPKITEIFVDVYGFSRGATAARTFANWLLEMFEGDTLCGVPAHIRFLGLFDTVASVGVPASSGLAEGHLSWADAPWLRVPAQVKNCVHYVAMHENRPSFPVELVRRDGLLPPNCQEFMFPGMHSDVGGGYTPKDQGKGPGARDDEKLSQLPLEAMYLASMSAKVPLNKAIARVGGFDPFQVADNLRAAYTAFMSANQTDKMVRDWLFDYLAWRYQTRHQVKDLGWHARASREDREDILGATSEFQKDMDALELVSAPPTTIGHGRGMQDPRLSSARSRVARLTKEAPHILDRLKSAPAVPATSAALFAEYCHDSFAGFRPYDQLKLWGWDVLPGSWEPQGYLRWRRRYEGGDRQLVRLHADPDIQHASAQKKELSSVG